ncbi:MAG TPA: glycosyltransferase family 4 protein [Vicinamibacterales bacterium]
MRPVVFVVPGSLDARTGGSIYDRRIVDGLRARGWQVDVREVDVGDTGADIYATIPDATTVVADGLVFGARPDQAERHASRLRFVPVVHLPLAEEPGLDRDRATRLEDGERRAVACAAMVVVTGRRTVETMIRYGVPRERVVLIVPGTDRAPLARRSDAVVRLLTVATVNAGKGHAILMRALAAIEPAGWRLTCVGSLARDAAEAARITALVPALRLADRVTFTGELDGPAVDAAYAGADVFVLPTRHETFGMAVAEAIAHGLPVVSTPAGAIAEIAGDGALLVPPGDVAALSAALARVIAEPALRDRLAAGARAARQRLPSWDAALDRMCAVLTAAAHGRVAF